MDKNQILLEEIGRRLKELEKKIDSHYEEIDKLERVYDELNRIVMFARDIKDNNEDECDGINYKSTCRICEKLDCDCDEWNEPRCIYCGGKILSKTSNSDVVYYCEKCGEEGFTDEEDEEELNGLKKDYSEVCGSFEEFKKQFDSMINRNKVHCRDCDGEMILDSDEDEEDYYYCEKCGYECYPDENGVEFHDSNCCCDKCEPIICDCGGDMTLKFDEDGDEYYHCTQCCDIYYPDEEEDDCTPDLFRDEPVDPCDDCDDCDCDCDNCEFNDEDDEEDFEDYTITCRKCCGDMFEEIDEEGDRYYECSNCGRVEYM